MTDRDIFTTAVELTDPAARAAYLDRVCAGDPALRERIESLLASHDAVGSFLGMPLVSSVDPVHAATQDFRAGTEPTEDSQGTPGPDDALAFLVRARRPGALGRIAHYEVLQVLGRGAFGIVFRAFDDVLQRVVAVKVLSPQMAATSPARKRFLREARTSAAVRHENVVQVYEVGEAPLPYLVMEFIPGETLQQRLDRTGPVDPAEVVRVGRQLAEGLAAAHAQGLIHRDIKPGNVLMEGGAMKVKITDFGLARAADDASISQSGIIAGTPMYMAPEQAKGDSLDHRADLFSLGSVLYQMATGRPPFRASTTLAVLKRVTEDEPRPIHEVIPETPKWLCDIISKLHAKNPDDRFQSAREVADVLAACEERLKASTNPGGSPVVLPRKTTGEPRSRRTWVAVAALVGCVLAAVAIAIPQLLKDRDRVDQPQPPITPPGLGPGPGPGPGPGTDAARRETLKQAAPRDAVLLMSFDPDTFDRKNDRVEVRDLSGRGNSGVAIRMNHTPDGKVGGGLRCEGGSLTLARSLIAKQPEYTVTAWCRLEPANRGDDFCILRTSGNTGADLPIYRFEIGADRSCLVHAWHTDRAEFGKVEQWVQVATPPDTVPDGWVFVAVTLTRGGLDTGATRIVVDDKVMHRKSQIVGPEADPEDYIGWKNAAGVIDELTVFHRALSDGEIAALRELGRNNISIAELGAPSKVEPKVSPPTGPFVILARDADTERRFATLNEAVVAARDGDTLEIRGNGPFESDLLDLGDRSLSLRAGPGCNPTIRFKNPSRLVTYVRAQASLSLEGLNLETTDPQYGGVIVHCQGHLRVANCRLLNTGVNVGVAIDANKVDVANCFIVSHANFQASLDQEGYHNIDNSVLHAKYANILLANDGFGFTRIARRMLRLTDSTFVAGTHVHAFRMNCRDSPVAEDLKEPLIVLDSARNYCHVSSPKGAGLLGVNLMFRDMPDADALGLLRRAFRWSEKENVYNVPAGFGTLSCFDGSTWQPHRVPLPTLAKWHEFWEITDSKSREGAAIFENGNRLHLGKIDPPRIQLADFRLAKGSPGQGVLPDGKDVGADLDLVGPGAAYDRWKQTPAYREWQNRTR